MVGTRGEASPTRRFARTLALLASSIGTAAVRSAIRTAFLLAAFLLAAFLPCVVGAEDLASEHQAAPFIDRANTEWETAIIGGDADTLARPYADDAVFVKRDGTTVTGRVAIRAMYAAAAASGASVVKASIADSGRAAAGSDDVYEWGAATMQIRSQAGKLSTRESRFLTVWHRDQTGRWEIRRNLVF